MGPDQSYEICVGKSRHKLKLQAKVGNVYSRTQTVQNLEVWWSLDVRSHEDQTGTPKFQIWQNHLPNCFSVCKKHPLIIRPGNVGFFHSHTFHTWSLPTLQKFRPIPIMEVLHNSQQTPGCLMCIEGCKGGRYGAGCWRWWVRFLLLQARSNWLMMSGN